MVPNGASEETRGEEAMADSKSKRGKSDRRRVAGGQGYEVNYFANKHGLTREQARTLIARVGNDRDKLNKAAEKLSKRR
jgi:Protein of unknown function (DUF3606)